MVAMSSSREQWIKLFGSSTTKVVYDWFSRHLMPVFKQQQHAADFKLAQELAHALCGSMDASLYKDVFVMVDTPAEQMDSPLLVLRGVSESRAISEADAKAMKNLAKATESLQNQNALAVVIDLGGILKTTAHYTWTAMRSCLAMAPSGPLFVHFTSNIDRMAKHLGDAVSKLKNKDSLDVGEHKAFLDSVATVAVRWTTGLLNAIMV